MHRGSYPSPANAHELISIMKYIQEVLAIISYTQEVLAIINAVCTESDWRQAEIWGVCAKDAKKGIRLHPYVWHTAHKTSRANQSTLHSTKCLDVGRCKYEQQEVSLECVTVLLTPTCLGLTAALPLAAVSSGLISPFTASYFNSFGSIHQLEMDFTTCLDSQ